MNKDQTVVEKIVDLATMGLGEGSAAASAQEIEDYAFSQLSEYVGVHTDKATLPIEAEIRSNQGPFRGAIDVFQYLEEGGLIDTDVNGVPIVNGIVDVVHLWDVARLDYIYNVYIRDNSP